MDNEKVYQMPFAKVYPLLVNKAMRKGRTQAEVDETYRDLRRFQKMSLHNIAGAGVFAADRSIREYAENIWGLKPVRPEPEKPAAKSDSGRKK